MAEVIGIDHIYLTVSDLARSEAFYDRVLLQALGFRKNRFALGGDEHVQYYNRHFGIVLRPARVSPHGRPKGEHRRAEPEGSPAIAAHSPYAPGLHHLCLRVDSIDEVRALARTLQAEGVGATDAAHYPQYADDYHATFFEDPDGIRLEVTNYRAERRARHDHWS